MYDKYFEEVSVRPVSVSFFRLVEGQEVYSFTKQFSNTEEVFNYAKESRMDIYNYSGNRANYVNV